MEMTPEKIELRLKEIQAVSHDAEVAHELEDLLYVDFIRYISRKCGDKDVKHMAKLVLKAEDIDFPRWCA